MNCTKKVLIVLLPILILGCILGTNVSYADVKVNITEEKTEPYSNKKDSDTIIINNDEKTPLNDKSNKESTHIYESDVDTDESSNSYKSDVDTDEHEVITESNRNNVDSGNYESVIDVSEQDVPGTDSYYDSTFNKESTTINDGLNYVEELYVKKIDENATYEIINKDLVVQNTSVTTDANKVKYTTLPKGTEVKVVGFTNPGMTRFVEILVDDGNIYYENVESFYNNTIKSNSTPVQRYIRTIVNDAKMLGSEKGYISCILFAVIYLIGTILLIKFLDSSIFRLRNADDITTPYINSVARIMPGAMVGSFIIIANMFDSNAVAYYFYKGFNLLFKNYELIHWLLQIIIIYALYMVGRVILEGLKCFTAPCMIIRTIILLVANIASFYLCYALSYVGIAVYVLFVLYQCICVNAYGCPDIGEEVEDCGEDAADEGEGEGEAEGADAADEGEPEVAEA